MVWIAVPSSASLQKKLVGGFIRFRAQVAANEKSLSSRQYLGSTSKLVGGLSPCEQYESVGILIPHLWKNKKMFRTNQSSKLIEL